VKQKMQLSFENIVIKSVPKQKKKCLGGRSSRVKPAEPKVILNGVSGTIMPG
jgi:hypothetical protein